MRFPGRTHVAGLVLILVAGCGGSGPAAGPRSETPAPTAEPTATGSATPSAPGSRLPDPTASRTPDAAPLPPVPARLSLPALMREDLRGGRIRFLRRQLSTPDYTRDEITHPSGDLRVSGVLLRPRGRGPFPAVVLNHGYIEPSVYQTGQGLRREQDLLARAGFVVLHTDYRGHAASDPGAEGDRETRLGYARDAIEAVQSLKRLPYVDPDRVAMLGRSMGGAVTYNALVAKPGLVRAAVVFAPVSSDFLDNFRRWTLAERPDVARATYRRHGTPAERPDFYRGLSARTYFDRVTEPVLIHHGTRDESCPIRWSRETHRLLRRAGVDSRLEVYPGEQHAFGPQWPRSMRLTVRFLRRQLGG